MTTDAERRRELLARVPLFGRLSPQEIDELLAVCHARTLAAGAELFHKGDRGMQVFAILRGRLKVMTTSAEGDDLAFGIMDPGEVFGELALLADAGGARTATVVAMEDCELLVLDRREFVPFLRAHPDAAIRLLETLAERVRRISELVEDTLFLNLPSRLAKKLLALAEAYGQESEGGIRIDLEISQEELGNFVGTTRESINKQMKQWRDEGIARMEKGRITILNLRRIEALAGMIGH
jgi:CRP-like cAMP-binding protein